MKTANKTKKNTTIQVCRKKLRHIGTLFFAFLLSYVPFAPNLNATPANQNHAWNIGFQIRHAFKTVDGKLRIKNPPHLENYLETGKGYHLLSPFDIRFAVSSLTTFNSNRDSHMLETLLYPRYKTATLRISTIQAKDKTHYRIAGQLTLVGKTRKFTSQALVKDGYAQGGFAILLSNFGIEPPSLLFMKVHDKVSIFYKVPLPAALKK